MAAETLISLKLFGPELTIIAFLVILFLSDAFMPQSRQSSYPLVVTLIGCVFGCWITWRINVDPSAFFSGMVMNDGLSNFFRFFFLFACGASLYLSYGSKEVMPKNRMEFSLLLLCVTFGLSLMAIASNLLILYIGIETVSIVSFAMAGFNRESLRSNEASLKYLVFGGLASGVMIYGFSLLYGYTGSLQYVEVGKYLALHAENTPFIVIVAVVMAYAGLAYKISAFPMHFWTPDVYEGAPTPVATFFSVGPKAAGFAALIRIVIAVLTVKNAQETRMLAQPLPGFHVIHGIAAISAITMLIGNLSALGQKNVKRMLAYSSIAHVGYMLMGLVALSTDGLSAILFYLVAYCLMNMGAFWVVSIVSDLKGSEDLDAFRGLGWRMPVLGICMGVFLFSLTGIPIFAGFIGKFLLFGALLQTPGYLWLAIFGVLNSVVSLYYYSLVVKAMWLDRPEFGGREPELIRLSLYHAAGLVGLALPTVVLGLFFTPVINFARQSLASFL